MTNYDKIKTAIKEMPATYLPGIMAELCARAKHKNIFQGGGLKRFLEKVDVKTADKLATDCGSDHTVWRNKGFNFCPICGEYLRPSIFGDRIY